MSNERPGAGVVHVVEVLTVLVVELGAFFVYRHAPKDDKHPFPVVPSVLFLLVNVFLLTALALLAADARKNVRDGNGPQNQA